MLLKGWSGGCSGGCSGGGLEASVSDDTLRKLVLGLLEARARVPVHGVNLKTHRAKWTMKHRRSRIKSISFSRFLFVCSSFHSPVLIYMQFEDHAILHASNASITCFCFLFTALLIRRFCTLSEDAKQQHFRKKKKNLSGSQWPEHNIRVKEKKKAKIKYI